MGKTVRLTEGVLRGMVAEALRKALNEGVDGDFGKEYPVDNVFDYMGVVDGRYEESDDWYEQVFPQLKQEYEVVWDSESGENERGETFDNTDFRMSQEFNNDVDKLHVEGWPNIKADLKKAAELFIENNLREIESDAADVVSNYDYEEPDLS